MRPVAEAQKRLVRGAEFEGLVHDPNEGKSRKKVSVGKNPGPGEKVGGVKGSPPCVDLLWRKEGPEKGLLRKVPSFFKRREDAHIWGLA